MGIKRSVVLTCDGPCGTVITGSVVPEDWAKVAINKVRDDPKVANRPSTMALCPSCTSRLYIILTREGYGFVEPQPKEVVNVSD